MRLWLLSPNGCVIRGIRIAAGAFNGNNNLEV
jgi:formylmethanofuran dehydrogenase subunit E